jgi:penicillin-binding protein 1A
MKKIWNIPVSRVYPQDCPTKGMVDLGRALAQSNNCAFMRTQAAVGFDKVKEMAIKLGLTPSGLDPNQQKPACFTIGCDALVKPLDMALAYGTIANDGRKNPAHFVSKVEDRTGKVLFQFQPSNEQVVSTDVARQAIIGLEKVVTSGTYSAGALPQGRPAAGKTGTTEIGGGANTDVWFIGFTPQISTAVWIGNPAANTNMTGGKVQGGATAAKVWRAFMAPYLDGSPVLDFPSPGKVGRASTIPDVWSKSGSKSGSSKSSKYGTSSSGTGSSGTGSSGTGSSGTGSSGTGSSGTGSSGTKSTRPGSAGTGTSGTKPTSSSGPSSAGN